MSFITDAGDRVAAGCVQRFLYPRHRNVDGRKNEPPPGVPTTRPWWPSAPPLMIDLSAIGFAGHGLAFKIALDEARISVG